MGTYEKGESIVSVFSYQEDNALRIKSFPKMTDEWLDFVVDCRRGIKHEYDIVEGPMADDQIWDYVEDFMEGAITREAFGCWLNSSIRPTRSYFVRKNPSEP